MILLANNAKSIEPLSIGFSVNDVLCTVFHTIMHDINKHITTKIISNVYAYWEGGAKSSADISH